MTLKGLFDKLRQADPDASEAWRRRSDDQVMAAMMRLEDYEEEGQRIIHAEFFQRFAVSLPEHPALHVYLVRNPAGGMTQVVSVVPQEVAFAHGSVVEAVVGAVRMPSRSGGTATPENFDVNPLFANFLHDVIARHGPDESSLIEQARRRGHGKVDVVDGRCGTPDGPVPAADILGSFGVDQGVIVAGSYERNPIHTVFSATGFFQLSPSLHAQLAAELARRTVRWSTS